MQTQSPVMLGNFYKNCPSSDIINHQNKNPDDHIFTIYTSKMYIADV